MSRNGMRNQTRGPSRRAVLAGSAVTLGTGLAGCLGGDDDESDPVEELDPDNPPEKPDSITVRAWGGVWEESLDSSVAQPFTEETGIEVNFDNTHESEMRTQIRTAIDQDREPPVNVDWTTDKDGHRAYREGSPVALHPDIISNKTEMRDMATPDTDDGLIPYLSLFSYTYSLCYNEEVIEDEHGDSTPARSWEELIDSSYEGDLGVYENGHGVYRIISALSNVALESEADDDVMDPFWETMQDFEPAVGLIADDTRLTEGILEGDVPYSCMLPNNIVDARDDGEPVDWIVPEEGAAVQTDIMYTPQNQSHSELYWAQEFVNMAADADAQTNWTESLGLPMLNTNADPADWMVDDPAFPTDDADFDNLLSLDPDLWARHSSGWIEEFNRIMQ